VIALIPGLLTGLSLIIAIGAQNAYVIRQGLAKDNVLLVVLFCAISDAFLIVLGASGLGALIQAAPDVLEMIRWFGVIYLSWFGIRSLRSAFKSQKMEVEGATSQDNHTSKRKVIATLFAFTYLNPHVYLDTVIFLGSIANQFSEDKWFFVTGAALGSFLWFFTIGFGAKKASRFMSRPIFWKILDLVIAAVMFTVAIILALYSF
jgi:L-lysine exporter family protein LysE/ArgO